MNAYELAYFIDKYCEDNTSKEAAVLLRQQADRIVELEKFNKAILKKGQEKIKIGSGVTAGCREAHSFKGLISDDILTAHIFYEVDSHSINKSGTSRAIIESTFAFDAVLIYHHKFV